MQGIFINGMRPKSKKQVKEAIASGQRNVAIEATSLLGNEFDGPVFDLPVGHKCYCVGPDPYTSRKFYLTIERTAKGVKVT